MTDSADDAVVSGEAHLIQESSLGDYGASSITVVTNSLRLTRMRRRPLRHDLPKETSTMNEALVERAPELSR